MARSTVFRYRQAQQEPLQIGRELKVRAVVVGRLTQHGDMLNVQTEMVDVSNGSQIWGDQYNRKLTDVMAIQEEISQEISEKLRVRLTGEDKKRLVKRHMAQVTQGHGDEAAVQQMQDGMFGPADVDINR